MHSSSALANAAGLAQSPARQLMYDGRGSAPLLAESSRRCRSSAAPAAHTANTHACGFGQGARACARVCVRAAAHTCFARVLVPDDEGDAGRLSRQRRLHVLQLALTAVKGGRACSGRIVGLRRRRCRGSRSQPPGSHVCAAQHQCRKRRRVLCPPSCAFPRDNPLRRVACCQPRRSSATWKERHASSAASPHGVDTQRTVPHGVHRHEQRLARQGAPTRQHDDESLGLCHSGARSKALAVQARCAVGAPAARRAAPARQTAASHPAPGSA
jgi:hypothetical protein